MAHIPFVFFLKKNNRSCDQRRKINFLNSITESKKCEDGMRTRTLLSQRLVCRNLWHFAIKNISRLGICIEEASHLLIQAAAQRKS